MSLWGSISFQDSYSNIGEYLGFFYEGVMCLVVFVLSLILSFLIDLLVCSWVFGAQKCRTLNDNQVWEVAWTVTPFLCLVGVAVPSIHLLYLIDEIGSPEFSFKAVGHQWYWSYEFIGAGTSVVEIESFMEIEFDGATGYRLLDVDQRMVIPTSVDVRCLVSSQDVIHSFSLPACMIKVDAVPGRINELPLRIEIAGVLYGQCSEICGVNHSFMPIVLEAVPPRIFNQWWSWSVDGGREEMLATGFEENVDGGFVVINSSGVSCSNNWNSNNWENGLFGANSSVIELYEGNEVFPGGGRILCVKLIVENGSRELLVSIYEERTSGCSAWLWFSAGGCSHPSTPFWDDSPVSVGWVFLWESE